ncbi:odorant receptor 131-2-like [Nelusetta ayraudi]|uniref:odorant receptor 131-2-like n=1 Tax=Nelusetta ayraudi TaxID=303726 RepID=UPI003F707F6B
MSNLNQSSTNSTVGVNFVGILEVAVFTTITSLPCCVFIFINCTMLFTLRSKTVFYETPRFVLVFNLLLADTVLLFQTQSMYLMSAGRVRLSYHVCFLFSMIAEVSLLISPLTLLAMSLERYVAVCYPLRHTSIITIRNTGAAIVMIWAFGFLNAFVQVVLLLKASLSKGITLKTSDYCGKERIFPDPNLNLFKTMYIYFWYILAAVIISSTYVGVMVAAWSTSTDKISAQKAGKTLMLHMVQLSISLCVPIHYPIVFLLSKHLNRTIVVRIQGALYVFVVMFPRCLSSLIYGLRDQTIRPVLIRNLLCELGLAATHADTNQGLITPNQLGRLGERMSDVERSETPD